MNDKKLQAQLDLQKWLDSEANKVDMCGKYEYCKFCNKSDETPCANAFEILNAKKAAEKTVEVKKPEIAKVKVEEKDDADVQDLKSSLGKKFDYDKVMEKKANRKSLTFAEKYALSDDIVKERYAILQNALTSTAKGEAKIKSRISKQCDTYRRDGDIIAKVTIIGTSLRINLPLDPEAPEFCDGKTPHTDTHHKKVYEEVPFQFKINSKLALRRAVVLINIVKEK
ncbi:MAG: hypothetical protein MJ193_01000 [Clostridia bacterium]|nr:hypothetical protein [Clostridia bacterium]